MITYINFEEEFRECTINNDNYLKKFRWTNFKFDNEEIKKNSHELLKKKHKLSKKEKDLLIYIRDSFNYSQKDLHTLFEDKENFKRFIENYTKSSYLNREKKNIIRNLFNRSFKHAYSSEELEIFDKLFVDVSESYKIINEVIEIAIEREEVEKKRIKKYQTETPIAQKNVKIIEKNLVKLKDKYESIEKELLKHTNKDTVSFIFQKEFDMDHAILEYLSEFSVSIDTMELKNHFIDNENFIMTFSTKDNLDIIQFLIHLMSIEQIYVCGVPVDEIVHHCELNGVPLIGNWPLETTDIYDRFRYCSIPIIAYNNYKSLAPVYKNKFTKESVKVVINDLKETMDFSTDLDLAVFLYYSFLEPLNSFYKKRWEILKNIDSELLKYNRDFKKKKEKYLNNAIEKGLYKTKWKSEMKLYKSVKKLYPSAIYQYRSEWLDRQSLDIFIPDLNIGIEYQGKQHYEAIDFFGGEKSLKDRIYLDEQKREKCKLNSIKLIEWKYDEIISKSNIIKKIQAEV